MTKIVFIVSALFLISIVLKSNIERPVQATKPKVPAYVALSEKVDKVSSDLNELIASERTEAGNVDAEQTQEAIKAKITVKEELVDVAKLESAFSNDKVEKLVEGLSSTATASTARVASKTAPVATSSLAGAPAAAPLVSNAVKTISPPSKYYVQYGIFSSACRCEQVKDKLSQAGIESVMDKLDPEGNQWIVKSKPYSSRAEAINQLQAAQLKGYESYVVATN